jgi:uncharacterized protein
MMQTVDRRGVHIDQCQGCRGIFLDRGELEQIVNVEQSYYAAAPQYRGDSPPPYRGGHDPRYQSHQGHRYGDSPPPYGHGGHGGHRRRKSFLEELFD